MEKVGGMSSLFQKTCWSFQDLAYKSVGFFVGPGIITVLGFAIFSPILHSDVWNPKSICSDQALHLHKCAGASQHIEFFSDFLYMDQKLHNVTLFVV